MLPDAALHVASTMVSILVAGLVLDVESRSNVEVDPSANGYVVKFQLSLEIPKVVLDRQRLSTSALADELGQAAGCNWNIYLEKYWKTLQDSWRLLPHPLLDLRKNQKRHHDVIESIQPGCGVKRAREDMIWPPLPSKQS